jgi:hypothetical protein
MMWSTWLWVLLSGEVEVYLWMFRWEHSVLLMDFRCGCVYNNTSSFLVSLRQSFPRVCMKLCPLPNVSKNLHPIFIFTKQSIRMPFPSMIKTVLLGINFVFSWCVCITKSCITSVAPYGLIHASYHQQIVLSYAVKWARSGTFCWGTALQVGRSRDRFPMVSLKCFVEIIIPAALWTRGWLSL